MTLEQLAELVTILQERHLIISHLLDVTPPEIGRGIDRELCRDACRQADAALEQVDLQRLDPYQVRKLSFCERALWQQSDAVMDAIRNHPKVKNDPAVAGCVAGLQRAEDKTKDAAAAFNTSVITYNSQSDDCPKIVRCFVANEPAVVVDLIPYYSNSSEQSDG